MVTIVTMHHTGAPLGPSVKACGDGIEVLVAAGLCLIHPTTPVARQRLADHPETLGRAIPFARDAPPATPRHAAGGSTARQAGEVAPGDIIVPLSSVHLLGYREHTWKHHGQLRLAVDGRTTPIELTFGPAGNSGFRRLRHALDRP